MLNKNQPLECTAQRAMRTKAVRIIAVNAVCQNVQSIQMDRCNEAKSPQIDLLNCYQFIIDTKKVKNGEKRAFLRNDAKIRHLFVRIKWTGAVMHM